MATSSAVGSGTITDLVSKVMNKYDTDKDGKMSSAEFRQFLSGLLGQAAGDTATAAAAPVSGTYRNTLAGFDFEKLDNPTLRGADTIKYRAARIFQDYKPMPESLPAVIDRLRASGINAVQVSFDKVDFGDGFGPIDVIQGAYPGGGVAWQWLRPEAA